METFVLWYFGIGTVITIILGLAICWISRDIEIDSGTDLVLGLGIISVFISWPIIVVMGIFELIKFVVWTIRNLLNSGK